MNMDTEALYEIYRMCRLCGNSGGYKIPILQSILPVAMRGPGGDELRLKIWECMHIEVSENDNMPPLICDICTDKVTEYYEFLTKARNINRQTRQRLGLPPLQEPVIQGGSDGDSILGVTEPIYVDDDDGPQPPRVALKETKKPPPPRPASKPPPQPASKPPPRPASKPPPQPASKNSLETELNNLLKDKSLTITKTSRSGRSPVATQPEIRRPAPVSRASKRLLPHPPPHSPERRVAMEHDDEDYRPLDKRARDVIKTTTTHTGKKVRLIIKQPIEPEPAPKPEPKTYRPGPKSSKREPQPEPEPKRNPEPVQKPPEVASKMRIQFETPKTKKEKCKEKKRDTEVSAPKSKQSKTSKDPSCNICDETFKNVNGLFNHQRSHVVSYTDPKHACGACGEWFVSADAAQEHHKWHKASNATYRCRRCQGSFKRNIAFMQHMDNNCVPWPEVKGVKCGACWEMFATQRLADMHICGGEDARPGGQCKTCKRTFGVYKTLRKHEASCGTGKKVKEEPSLASLKKKKDTAVKISGSVRRQLIDMDLQVRMVRCDSILNKHKRVNVNYITQDFDLVKTFVYPYKKQQRVVETVKKQPPATVKKQSLATVKKQPPATVKTAASVKKPTATVKKTPATVKKTPATVKTAANVKKQRLAAKVKEERWSFDGMVCLGQNVRNELYKEEDYVHWDSDCSSDEDEFDIDKPNVKKVDSLSVLSLKTLFSPRCLGKVPRKLRKIKPDKKLDSFYNNDEDFSLNINSIIGSLDDNDDGKSGSGDINNIINNKSDTSDDRSDKIKMLSDKIDKALDVDTETTIDNTKSNDFDSLFNDKSDAKVDGGKNGVNAKSGVDNGKSGVDNAKSGVGNAKSGVDNAKSGVGNGKSVVGENESVTNNIETSNLAGFDIDIDINSDTKTVNGQSDTVSEKIDSFGTSVKSAPYLDRISDEEFNFDA